jgi:hypothetical protein
VCVGGRDLDIGSAGHGTPLVVSVIGR